MFFIPKAGNPPYEKIQSMNNILKLLDAIRVKCATYADDLAIGYTSGAFNITARLAGYTGSILWFYKL